MSFVEVVVICTLATIIMCVLLGNWNLLCYMMEEGVTKVHIIQMVKELSIGEFILLPFIFPAIIIYLIWSLLRYRPFSKGNWNE